LEKKKIGRGKIKGRWSDTWQDMGEFSQNGGHLPILAVDLPFLSNLS